MKTVTQLMRQPNDISDVSYEDVDGEAMDERPPDPYHVDCPEDLALVDIGGAVLTVVGHMLPDEDDPFYRLAELQSIGEVVESTAVFHPDYTERMQKMNGSVLLYDVWGDCDEPARKSNHRPEVKFVF
jgi:hypothetical protein